MHKGTGDSILQTGTNQFGRLAVLLSAAFLVCSMIGFPSTPAAGESSIGWTAQPPMAMPEFTAEEWEELREGKPLTRNETFNNSEGKRAGRGVSYILIHAAPPKIWEQILDYDRYAEFYPHVKECKLYRKEGDQYFSRFTLSVFGFIDITYHVRHVHRPEKDNMTWELDRSRENEFKDTTGFWKIWPVEGGSLLAYSVYVDSGRSIPGFIEEMATGYGLRKVTSAMKRRVESGGTYKR